MASIICSVSMYDLVRTLDSTQEQALETEQIDELLARYRAAEGRIASNLVELDSLPTYKILSGGGLEGKTLAQVGSAMAKTSDLWRWLSQLQSVLNDADEIRSGGRMNTDRRERVADLLTGRSVLLAVDETPVAERDLLGAASTEIRVTIDHLLAQMRQDYEPLRDAVAAVDRVWTEVVPRTDSADTTLRRLRVEVDRLDVVEPTVNLLERRLDEVRRALANDPISLADDYAADLDRLLLDATGQMAALARGHDELEGDIAATETVLAEVRVLRGRAATAHTQSTNKIANPKGLIPTPNVSIVDGPNGLAARADLLRTSSLSWQQKRDSLDAWSARLEAFRDQLTRAYAVNALPLRRRDQLRGLLSAYWAKAAAVGRSEDANLSDLHDDAYNELFTSPTDIARAESLVTEFGSELRAPSDTMEPATGEPS